MSTYRLETLFAPRSVAVVGASPRQTSTGRAVLANLRSAGFAGTIHLVNPRYDAIEGIRAFKSYDALPEVPDVVAIAVPPAAVPDAVAAAARKRHGGRHHHHRRTGHGPGSLAELCEKNARAAGMRLVGPNCLGVLVPRAKLNASFAASMPPAGDLALISQSGAIAAGWCEWAPGAVSDFPPSSRSATASMSTLPICSTTSLWIAATRAILALHRIDQRRPQIHVGGARRGAHQAGAGDQIRAPRPGRQSGADAHRRAGRFGCGL